MSTYTQLLNTLDQLKLIKMREILPNYIDSAVINEKSCIDIIKELKDR